jgi:S-(hydroxymethyl)glutathione dehydrogenase/alcohol dehydrogenase
LTVSSDHTAQAGKLTTRAALWRPDVTELVIEPVTLAAPGPDEVAVKIAAVAICQSDLAFIDGHWDCDGPAVFGHEAAGVVTHAGAEAGHLAVGDRVCVTLARACFDCANCKGGRPVDCLGSTDIDGRVIIRTADGSPTLQGLKTGAFAEHVVVHHSQVAAIPETVPWASASVLSCAVLTGHGAVTRTAALMAGQTALVIGAGGVGLNCVQAASINQAAQIIAVDLSDSRLEAALDFGATDTLNPGQTDMVTQVLARTGGLGVDHAFVCAASEKIIDQAVSMLAPGGAVVIVGMPRTGVTCRYDPLVLATANRSIRGSKFGQAIVQEDIAHLAALYEARTLMLDEMVTNQFPFARINDALDATRQGEGLRNVVMFDWAKHHATGGKA